MNPIHWQFPLPRTHTGILLGNGLQGLMVWGENALHLTVGRAGFWDHRGGNAFASRATYSEVRRLLEAGDEPGLRALFAGPPARPGEPTRPHQVGGGRIELHFADGFRPVSGRLHTREGRIEIALRAPDGREAGVRIGQARGEEVAWIDLDEGVRFSVRTVASWDCIGEQLAKVGVQPPERWEAADAGGFEQRLPEDAPLALAWVRRGSRVVVATALGAGAAERARGLADSSDADALAAAAGVWWEGYWRGIPELELPDPELQLLWEYGVFKQAGLTAPCEVAATLQGPWMEEYQLPPWSNDYHFNINIEMIYWPALGTGRWGHFEPLWRMIRGWMPELRANAAHFFGSDEALMLPHAVDDRCHAVGTFWTGMIDHACTAWMAQMAWLHYRHSLDEAVLRDVAWPLLRGAFAGYWAMIEERDGRLSLPVSVSPEFKGARMDAWGRDASFQLAACHAVVRILPEAAAALGEPVDPRWERVRAGLPPYSTVGVSQQREYPERQVDRVALWEGMDLIESHRHHSHLGGIFPFCTIDVRDPDHRRIVQESLYHWVRTGPGAWSGWCVPWAAILCARVGWADGAVAWLKWWNQVFTNEGRGTLHDADFGGATTLFGTGAGEAHQRTGEIMQVDAGMGVVTALIELLVQQRADGLYVMPAVPDRWRDFRFRGIYVQGAFRVGATVAGRRTVEVEVESLRGGRIRLHHGLGPRWEVEGEPGEGEWFEREFAPGERVVLRAMRER